MKSETVKRLAQQVAAKAGVKTGPKRRLRVVGVEPPPALSALQRDVVYSQIRDLGNLYWLNWLIRQETRHKLGVLECLSDDELQALLATMERGRECRIEGIAFDDAGLVRAGTTDCG
jgi:hypothetical protein